MLFRQLCRWTTASSSMVRYIFHLIIKAQFIFCDFRQGLRWFNVVLIFKQVQSWTLMHMRKRKSCWEHHLLLTKLCPTSAFCKLPRRLHIMKYDASRQAITHQTMPCTLIFPHRIHGVKVEESFLCRGVCVSCIRSHCGHNTFLALSHTWRMERNEQRAGAVGGE